MSNQRNVFLVEPRPSDSRWRGDDAPTPLNPPDVRVAKDSPVIHTLGSFQELSAALGMARAALAATELDDHNRILKQTQRDLYVIKADLASATDDEVIEGIHIPRPDESMLRAVDERVAELEARLGAKPDRFVLEGGSPAAAALYFANEVTRRVERLCVGLKDAPGIAGTRLQPKMVFCQQYLNHLSYVLYLMARVTNRRLGVAEESLKTDPVTGEVTVDTEPLP
ncbi:MAG: hypothetical protein V3T72_19380 [Thermoanaerobaculia bacterium]